MDTLTMQAKLARKTYAAYSAWRYEDTRVQGVLEDLKHPERSNTYRRALEREARSWGMYKGLSQALHIVSGASEIAIKRACQDIYDAPRNGLYIRPADI